MLINFAVYFKIFLICYFLFKLVTSINFTPKRPIVMVENVQYLNKHDIICFKVLAVAALWYINSLFT